MCNPLLVIVWEICADWVFWHLAGEVGAEFSLIIIVCIFFSMFCNCLDEGVVYVGQRVVIALFSSLECDFPRGVGRC